MRRSLSSYFKGTDKVGLLRSSSLLLPSPPSPSAGSHSSLQLLSTLTLASFVISLPLSPALFCLLCTASGREHILNQSPRRRGRKIRPRRIREDDIACFESDRGSFRINWPLPSCRRSLAAVPTQPPACLRQPANFPTILREQEPLSGTALHACAGLCKAGRNGLGKQSG